MDFIVGLPRTSKGYNSIWVIVEHLTKSAHFLPVDSRYSAKQYAELFLDRIVTLHGVSLNSRNALVPVFSEVQLIIHRRMGKQKG